MRKMKTMLGLTIPVFLGLALTSLQSQAAFAAKQTCVQKAAACERRCAGRYPNFENCIHRTCDKQYGSCNNGTTLAPR